MLDWLVAFDDLMCLRFLTCRGCGQAAQRLEMWTATNGFAMALAWCQRCLEADPRGQRRDALVEQHARTYEQTLLKER